MNKKLWIFILILSSISTTAAKADVIYGVGNSSCGTWTKHSKEQGSNHAFSASWIQGYITAVQINTKLKEVDSSALIEFINNYCKKNPLERIESAALDLTIKLMK